MANVRRAGPAGSAVTEQPPAGCTAGPGAGGPVDAVTDQRAPGQRLGGRVDRIEHSLSQRRQCRGGIRAVGPVGAQQQSGGAAGAVAAEDRAGPAIATVAAVAHQHRVAAGSAVATGRSTFATGPTRAADT
ncbi:hypothetical protein B1987_28885 [Mycobacterium kansasii]|nr:hypothetical protein B1987_28885 [Mycobacterium kansasii]